MDALRTRRLEAIALKQMGQGDIQRVLVRVPGRGGGGPRTGDVNSARAFVILSDWHERKRTVQEIAAIRAREAANMPGVRVSQASPAASAAAADRADRSRDRRAGLRTLAAVVRQDARSSREHNPGLANLETNYKERKPQMHVSVDRNRAADLGVSLQTRRAHARDCARLAHRHDLRRSRSRVQRHPARPATTRARPITDLTNIRVRSTRGDDADSAVERGAARRDGRRRAAQSFQSPALDRDLAPTSRPATPWARRSSGSRTPCARELPPERR